MGSVRCQLRDLGELSSLDSENPKPPVPLLLLPEIQTTHLSCGREAGGIRMHAGGKEVQESVGV